MGREYVTWTMCYSLAEIQLVANLKKCQLVQVNPRYANKGLTIKIRVDEMRSFVGSKQRLRWLWWVEDAVSDNVFAFVFSRRTHTVLRCLIVLWKAAQTQISGWITDAW